MLRVLLALIGVGVAAALGVWLLEESLIETLLKLVAAVVLLIIVGAVPVMLLQRFSPTEPDEHRRT